MQSQCHNLTVCLPLWGRENRRRQCLAHPGFIYFFFCLSINWKRDFEVKKNNLKLVLKKKKKGQRKFRPGSSVYRMTNFT